MSNKLSLLVNFIAVDKMSGALRNFVGLGRDGSKSLKALSAEAKKLDRDMAKLKKDMAADPFGLKMLVSKEEELARKIAATNTQLEKQKRLAAINSDTRAWARRGDELKASGQSNMIGGAAMSAPLILAAKAAMDFSSGMVDIQQKAELSNAETAKMADNIILLARAAHQLPEAMRGSVDVLSGFGLDPRQALQMIGPIGRLGTAFKVDLSDGAAAAYANLNNLKVPISETARALDIMAAGGNAGAFEVKDMARWFPKLTAQLQALGQKGTPAVADLTAALQVAMNTAGSADEAANNIANLLGKVNAKATATAFQKNFGIDLPAAIKAGVAKGQTTMEAFAEVAQKATKGDLSKLGWGVEDRQAQMGLLALIQNLDKYRQIRAQISSGSGGTVDRAFAQREAQDASIQWATFMGTAQELAITLGTRVLPAATRFLSQVSRITVAVSDWARRNPALAGALANLAVGLVGARIGLGALQFALGSVLGPAASFIGFFRKAQVLGSVAAMLPRLAAGFGLLTGPIGLTVLAVAGFAYAVYRYWGPISGFFRRHWTQIRNLFLGAMVIFTPMIAAAVFAASVIYRNWDRIKAATHSMIATVSGILGPFIRPWLAIQSFLAGLVGKFFGFGVNIISGLINGVLSKSWAVIKAFLDLAGNIGARFGKALGINSPSRVFMAFGHGITDGLTRGVDRTAHLPIRSVGRMATGVAAAGAISLAPVQPAMARPGGLTPIRPASPALAAAARGGPVGGGPIEIHVHPAPGQSPDEIAEAVMRKLERAKGMQARRSFEGDR